MVAGTGFKNPPRTHWGGTIHQIKSGRYLTEFRWDCGKLHPAPETFDTWLDPAAWVNGHTDA